MFRQFGYLTYIVQNYNHLPEVVVFSQGSLDDHLDLYPFRTFSHPVRLVEHLAHEAAALGYSQNYYDHRIGRMSAHRAFKLAVEYPHVVDSGQFFGQWFEANVRSPWVEDMTWFRNAVFGVSRDGILGRPREYYLGLLTQFQDKPEHEISHYLERSWFYVFNLDKVCQDCFIATEQTPAPGVFQQVAAEEGPEDSEALWTSPGSFAEAGEGPEERKHS
jgi:hypothetical protein